MKESRKRPSDHGQSPAALTDRSHAFWYATCPLHVKGMIRPCFFTKGARKVISAGCTGTIRRRPVFEIFAERSIYGSATSRRISFQSTSSRSEVRNPANIPTAIKGNTDGSAALRRRCPSFGVSGNGGASLFLLRAKFFICANGFSVSKHFSTAIP